MKLLTIFTTIAISVCSATQYEKEAEMIFVPHRDNIWASLRGGVSADVGGGVKLGAFLGVSLPLRGAPIQASFISLDPFVRASLLGSPFEVQFGPTILYSPKRKVASVGLRPELRLNISECVSAHIGIITNLKPSKVHAVPAGISLRF